MPDHVHFFARAAENSKPLKDWLRTWKSISSRSLSSELQIDPPIWQKDYFDRFLRSAENYTEKWQYVLDNPVRKGLVRMSSEWRWQGVVHELTL